MWNFNKIVSRYAIEVPVAYFKTLRIVSSFGFWESVYLLGLENVVQYFF